MVKKIVFSFILLQVVFGVSVTLASWEAEPNNTIQQANPISANGEYSGVISSSSDVDFFGFTVNEPGNLTISMPNNVDSSWYITLYNSSGAQLNWTYTDRGQFVSGDKKDEIGLSPGTYYISVGNSYNAINIPYIFKLKFDKKGLFEQEPNDSVQTATPFSLNNEYRGNLNSSADEDYYRFSLNEPGNITMSMPNDPNSAWYIYLYNSSGKELTYFNTKRGQFVTGSTSDEIGLPAGTYYIRVSDSYDASKKPYLLNIQFEQSRFYEQELNNTTQDATVIDINYRYQGVINTSNDTDFYRFDVDSPGSYTISIPNNEEVSWGLTIWDQHGDIIDAFTTERGSFISNVSSKRVGLKKGTYYLQVGHPYGSNPSKIPYSFAIEHQQFNDMNVNYWAYNEIAFLESKGIIKGYSNGTFRPGNQVTRSQAATMISRALGLSLNNVTNPGYRDVSTDFHSYREIAAVTNAGIFPKNATFRPNDNLTRAEMAAVLVKAYNLTGTYDGAITDVRDPELLKHVQALAGNGITNIYSDNTFRPNNDVTRAQFSAFFSRILDESFRD
ncbi:S-layer homology domain-containing protein [Alkalihalophilus pseudofirmus]|uniref:S-layer homology domain-containing protein n=1 Tax=Alkalihalophilus pseudofirmus TaxID=79885 RepID=A0AAJ2NQ22_ALKPS|nr:S-layer homology domain-containing protein [Alkalihalophilus pseudofirmus]MDV2886346.1 S-layer homology domain-containing protein [Alkalihalophilus pseudofirmus]